jgi:hypothetical protein
MKVLAITRLVDLGPSHSQTLSGLQQNSQEIEEPQSILGILPSLSAHIPKEKDANIVNSLIDGLDKCNKNHHTTIQFPYASPKPINEYEEDNSLFTRAFPWLFPGGLGDFGQYRDKKITVGDWARETTILQRWKVCKRQNLVLFCIGLCHKKKESDEWRVFC